jgi:CDP-diacylglycerol---serine O-phosphatidyltransferase
MPSAALMKRKRIRRARRTRREQLRAVLAVPVVPTLLTLGNVVCGLGSITLAAKSATAAGNSNSLYWATMLIFAAMVFDMLDGAAARVTRQCSQFGVQLDSLCDVVSFGVAPAFLLLQHAPWGYHPRVLWVIAALYLVCAVLRLARFNVETSSSDSHSWFSGLPSPGAAAVVASFSLVLAGEALLMPDWLRSLMANEKMITGALRHALPIMTVAVSILMVSRVRFPHIAVQSLRGRRRFQQLVQIIFAIAAILALGEFAAPLILTAYVCGAVLRAAWNYYRREEIVAEPQSSAVPAGESLANKPRTIDPSLRRPANRPATQKPAAAKRPILSILLGRRRV